MAKSNFNISEFKTQVTSEGLARQNRFEVLILPPSSLSTLTRTSRTVSLFCDAAMLPGMSITTKQLKSFGPAYQRPVSAEYGGDAINLVFHIDTDMRIKAFFDTWMNSIVDPKSFVVAYQEDYITQIEIRQLDENNNVTYSVKLIDAFPRATNMMDLNNSSNNQSHKLSVVFAYRKWESSHSILKYPEFSSVKLTDTSAITKTTL